MKEKITSKLMIFTKNYLRKRFLDTSQSNLSIVSIEKFESKLLVIEEIIDKFADAHNNRRIIYNNCIFFKFIM